ncbi:hypothetical protein evm_008830 [Chilo suppressalis]|nr:hypothetical protein evm_008830 [Chilo suppressalis]
MYNPAVTVRRIDVLIRILGNKKYLLSANYVRAYSSNEKITIGDVTKEIQIPKKIEYVPRNYLKIENSEIKLLSQSTLRNLRWMMQKDSLGQDMFLLGRPGPSRRKIALQYLELTKRELEYVALSRDTTEADLKQRHKAKNDRFINTTLFSSTFEISTSTIRRRLKEGSLKNRVPARKPTLTPRHKMQQLQFAANYFKFNFQNVIFMDEKVFCSSDNGRLSLWRPENTRYLEQNVLPNRRSGRISIGFWGWMCKDGPGELVEISGRMNAMNYKELLEDTFLPTAQVFYPEQQITFLQDNSSVHNARTVQTWINEQRELTLIKLPPKSPDLNPIENLWGKMVQEWDGNQCRTTEALRRHANDVWESFRGRGFCEKVVGSMRKRLQDVLNAEGGYTKY